MAITIIIGFVTFWQDEAHLIRIADHRSKGHEIGMVVIDIADFGSAYFDFACGP